MVNVYVMKALPAKTAVFTSAPQTAMPVGSASTDAVCVTQALPVKTAVI